MGGGDGSLFRTERARGRKAYKLFVCSMVMSIALIWFYRVSHILGGGDGGESLQKWWWWWSWIGLFAAEVWFSFYWIITQSVRWNPIFRFPFKEKLYQRYGRELPKVDVFVCTADPTAEPPALVISTVLSVMAYNYPPEKLSVYLSDDACSILTFYALWEASTLAKHWLPFCRKYGIEPRSPAAFFSKSCETYSEWSHMKSLYEETVGRINNVVASGKVPAEVKGRDGFSSWSSEMSSRDHQQIVKILIDGREPTAVDVDGNPLPTLVYMAREKRPEHHHNFKAGSMNALIRVSSVISNAPIILNVDCDMYSNNSESVMESLCFFLDEEGHDIAFVQYPQYFDNITKNDMYGNAMNVNNGVELPGLDGCGGAIYIGTGCFHRREALLGRIYNRDYKEDWSRGIESVGENASTLEERAMALATCTYELNTMWGKELGLIYGCAVEDIATSLRTHCRSWRSICYNPEKRGFLGVSPTTLPHTLLQYKRWGEGNLQIGLSKHCSFICGHGKIKVGLQMGYCVFNLRALNSIPTLYYIVVPPLCLLKGISLFPKISSPWIVPFAYVFIAKNSYSLIESLMFGDTVLGWWNLQRMWVLKRITAFLFATIEVFLSILGFSMVDFKLTSKTMDDQDLLKRYVNEVMEFGSSSPMITIIGAVAMLNLVCLLNGMKRVAMDGELETFIVQVLLCWLVFALNLPIYEGLFVRNDKGSIPASTALASIGFALLACLFFII